MNQTKATIYLQKAHRIISNLCDENIKRDCLEMIMQLQKAQRLLQQADKIILNNFAIENISHLEEGQKEKTIQEITKAYKLQNI